MGNDSISKALITAEDIQVKVRQIGDQISRDYAGMHPVLVGVLNGALIFMADLMREIDLPLEAYMMAASSYDGYESTGTVEIIKPLEASITGRHVILVEDIVDTGITLDSLLESLAEAGRIRDPDAPEVRWEYLSAESFLGKGTPEERVLEGENELRLLSSWFDRLGTTGILDPLSQWLSHYFPSQSAAQLENALYGLFETGMRNAGDVVRLRWPDGRSAYQVRILDRSYWLQPDGSLLLTPLTW